MATNESLVLGGVELNSDVGDFVIRDGSLSMNPPRKKPEWATGADADGAALVRDPLFDNRTIEFDLRVRGQSTTDGALAKIASISDKLEEAERQEDGMALVWTPAGGTKNVTFRVKSGEITELPITRTGDGRGYFRAYPTFHVVLTCKPFGYGPEVVGTAVTSSAPVVTTTVAGVTGDVPAEGRLIITDAASQARRHVEWGLEQRHYDPATSLLIDSDSLVTSGFAGAQGTRAGAYDPDALGNNVVASTVFDQPQAICGLGDLAHVGTFRVIVRAWVPDVDPKMRLAWQVGDGPLTHNAWASTPVRHWYEYDLGLVTIPVATLGAQQWTARIEGRTVSASDELDIDYVLLIPADEGYGLVRATYAYAPGVINARDEFTGTTVGGALNARVAPSGGSWATSGATTDFTFADGPGSGEESITRATTSDAGYRYAVLGATNYTDTEVESQVRWTAVVAELFKVGVLARWTDASNHLRVYLDHDGSSGYLRVAKVVAGTETSLGESLVTGLNVSTWYGVRVVVFASGRGIAQLLNASRTVLHQLVFSDSVLATGGTLATGNPGLLDSNPEATANTRYFDNFSHAAPAAESVAIYPSQSLEVRHNEALRENAAGTQWGRPQTYRGSRFLVPPAGSEARTSRVAVRARRHDVDTADFVTDSTTVQVAWTPRFVAVPR